ncbi:MAG: di-heme oxidoredictase family protein [Acidimicrobiales bacterium]
MPLAGLVIGLALLLLACGRSDGGAVGDPDLPTADAPARLLRPGGMTTAFDTSERAFSLTARDVNHYQRQVFAVGKAVFDVSFTATGDGDMVGLGPEFDAPSCATCHTRDGRSPGPDADGGIPLGMIVKLTTDDPAVIEAYGPGLTASAVDGPGEAAVAVRYETVTGTFDDGTPYELRRPIYRAETRDGPALPDDAVLGPRIAPQLPGLGLLEQVAVDDIEARADPDDRDGDGISGRLGVAHDPFLDLDVVGRFGWNATQPTVEQQTATALFNDMGLTSRYFPSETCGHGGPCAVEGGPVTANYEPSGRGGAVDGYLEPVGGEIDDRRLYELTVYTQILAVPAARGLEDPVVERGWGLFDQAGCASCHGGVYTTERGPIQGLSNQVIQPFTDLLVHDLGSGLADRTVGGEPVPTEWRTPPLWGLGLSETVNGSTHLLHDGRARSFEEAILWHDGEAAASAAAFRAMSAADRAALIRLLESL